MAHYVGDTLYAWTDPNPSTGYPQIVYTAVEKESVTSSSNGVDVYDNTGNIILAPEKMYYGGGGRRITYDSDGKAHIEWVPAEYCIGIPENDEWNDEDDDDV